MPVLLTGRPGLIKVLRSTRTAEARADCRSLVHDDAALLPNVSANRLTFRNTLAISRPAMSPRSNVGQSRQPTLCRGRAGETA